MRMFPLMPVLMGLYERRHTGMQVRFIYRINRARGCYFSFLCSNTNSLDILSQKYIS